MHFDFIAEGWKPDLDAFEEWMNTRSFNMPAKDKDGKDINILVPAALRLRKAYTYVFPREYLDVVLNSLKPETSIGMHDGAKNAKDNKKILGTPAMFLRKALKLKKIPKPDISKGEFPLVKKNIRILSLGYRDDIDIVQNGITHEGL